MADMLNHRPMRTVSDGFLAEPTKLPWYPIREWRRDDGVLVIRFFGWPQLCFMEVECREPACSEHSDRERCGHIKIIYGDDELASEDEILPRLASWSHDFEWWEFDVEGKLHRSGPSGATGVTGPKWPMTVCWRITNWINARLGRGDLDG